MINANSEYLNTAQAIREGFSYEIHNIANSGKEKIIQENALAIIDELSKLHGSSFSNKVRMEINQIRNYILNTYTPTVNTQPLLTNLKDAETIAGDGHCLFRSVAHGLVSLYKNANFEQTLVTKHTELEKVNDPNTQKLRTELKTLITLLPEGKSTKNSDKLQRVLRNIVCSYNELYHPDKAEGDPAAYFKAMRNSNKWGGGTEIEAFNELFGVQININTGRDILVYEGKKEAITLNYNGSHFNLAGINHS